MSAEERPSWPTALPARRARGGGRAEEEVEGLELELFGASSTATNASPLPYPSAAASKVLHLPSGAAAPRAQTPAGVAARSMALAPVASAASDEAVAVPEVGEEREVELKLEGEELEEPAPPLLLARSAAAARCAATSELEHAVSTPTHAPLRSNEKLRRPHMYGAPLPTKAAGLRLELPPASAAASTYSWYMHPAKTAVAAGNRGGVEVEVEKELEFKLHQAPSLPAASTPAAAHSSIKTRCAGSIDEASARGKRNAEASKWGREGTLPARRA